MGKLFSLIVLTLLLAGCGESLGEIKNAASGINSRANDAASAISIEVHTIRATELQFNNETFTINDLFKTILRDVQWLYDEKEQKLKVTGTWQDNGLFAMENFDATQKTQLLENGDIEVLLYFSNGKLKDDQTTISMQLQSDKLVEQTGSDVLLHLYEVYVAQ